MPDFRNVKEEEMQNSFWSWAESSRTQQAVCFTGQPAGGCAGVWEKPSCDKDMGTCSASRDKRLEKKDASQWMVCKMGWKTGETGPLYEKLRKCLFCWFSHCKVLPSPSSVTHSTPSQTHLPGLREKAPCNPICWLLIHTLLSLHRAGSWAWVSAARNFGFHIKSSQDGHLRNVSLHQNCLPRKEPESLLFPGKVGKEFSLGDHANTNSNPHLGWLIGLKGTGTTWALCLKKKRIFLS